jgi:GAF domain-containing protein
MSSPTLVEPSELDPLFASLPQLLSCAFGAKPALERARFFARKLPEVAPSLFSQSLVLFSRGGEHFVPVWRDDGATAKPRGWPRWPLERLFKSLHPCLITRPRDSVQALALPFTAAAGERYVVIAPMSATELSTAQKAFLEILQSVPTGSGSALASPQHRSGMDNILVDEAPDAPTLLVLGSGKELAFLAAFAAERGWSVEFVPTFGHVLERLTHRSVDALALDSRLLHSPIANLCTLRRLLYPLDLGVLYLDRSEASNEVAALVDECITPDAPKNEVVRAFKRLTSAIPARRARAIAARITAHEAVLASCVTYDELCKEIARGALSAGMEFAAVSLIDSEGALYRAEFPERDVPLVSSMPANFLSGYAIIRSAIDAEFFREAFDDAESIEAISRARPLSAASIPIIQSGRVAGTLLALTFSYRFSGDHAAGLMQLCDAAGRVLARLPPERRAPPPTDIDDFRSSVMKRSADSAPPLR